jgi:hypothetical protein
MPFTDLAIDVVKALPLLGAACAIAMASRAIVKGQVDTTGRMMPRRTVYRTTNPIRFWMEIGLYCATATFLLLLGLLLFDRAPNWFYEVMLHKSRRA